MALMAMNPTRPQGASPVRDDDLSAPKPLMQRFGFLIAFVAVVGAALALIADSPRFHDDRYWTALGGIGSAIVSGAVVALIVVWFEDRREDERSAREAELDDDRFRREQRREDVSAMRAWR